MDEEILRLREFEIDTSNYQNSDWIKVVELEDRKFAEKLGQVVDRGEAEAIALAKQVKARLLLIDERLGTKIAAENGIETVGLIGVLINAKEKGLITELKATLDQLEKVAGFYIGSKLRATVLEIVNET